jgi:glutamyl-tRNA reductase
MVREAMARRHNEAIFFIDIATPRDIEAEIGNLYNVFLFNLDDLNAIAEENRRRRQSEAELAERIVEAETDVFMRWLATLDIKTTIVELRGAFDELRNQEIEWLRSKLGDLPERDWNAIVQFSNRLTNKLLHRPLATLRETASEDDAVALAEAVHRLFGLEKETKSKDEG